MSILQIGKAFFDRLVCNRGNPQPFDRLMAACLFQNPAGNQFSLTACICGNDDFFNVFSKKLGFHDGKLLACLTDDHQLHVFGKHRKGCYLPLFVFLIVFFRICQSHKMSQCPGDHIFFALENTAILLVRTQNTGNISGNGWFFRDYK